MPSIGRDHFLLVSFLSEFQALVLLVVFGRVVEEGVLGEERWLRSFRLFS